MTATQVLAGLQVAVLAMDLIRRSAGLGPRDPGPDLTHASIERLQRGIHGALYIARYRSERGSAGVVRRIVVEAAPHVDHDDVAVLQAPVGRALEIVALGVFPPGLDEDVERDRVGARL